ncbi:MAG: DeoR/GlpR family DNA-binding transcription regulator [bacterium]
MVYSGKQRKNAILERIHQNGHVLVKELADEMQISEATVRRDLKALSSSQEVELIYGGATTKRGSDSSFRFKSQRNREAKHVVGELAAGLVHNADQLFMDSGTTTFEMAGFLKSQRAVSVIVNSIRLAEELSGAPDRTVIVLGGQYRADRMDMVGPLAISSIDQLRGYRAFIGADGLSMDFGLTASDIESAHLYRLVIQNARETILAVDHTKFAAPSLYKIVDWTSITKVVTDTPPTPEWQAFLSARSIALVFPQAQNL